MFRADPCVLRIAAHITLRACSRDEDPMVRGLALRSLTGLRLVSILEYVTSPLHGALTDSSGYVRQAGVIGILKVFHLSPSLVKEGDYVDTLYNMMRDKEPQVVINCISTLNEILAEEGGIAINQAMIHYLLGRIREFTDWGQCVVMELVVKYQPANEVGTHQILSLRTFGIVATLWTWLCRMNCLA
jgi:AP-4 complex subunit beta-1